MNKRAKAVLVQSYTRSRSVFFSHFLRLSNGLFYGGVLYVLHLLRGCQVRSQVLRGDLRGRYLFVFRYFYLRFFCDATNEQAYEGRIVVSARVILTRLSMFQCGCRVLYVRSHHVYRARKGYFFCWVRGGSSLLGTSCFNLGVSE